MKNVLRQLARRWASSEGPDDSALNGVFTVPSARVRALNGEATGNPPVDDGAPAHKADAPAIDPAAQDGPSGRP